MTEEFFRRVKQCRHNLLHPENRESITKALEEAAELMRSDEMGNYLSLSKIYESLK